MPPVPKPSPAETANAPAAAVAKPLRDLTTAERVQAYDLAEQALRDGGLVIAASESGPLAIARADAAAGIEALRAICRLAGQAALPSFPVWLAPGQGPVTSALAKSGLSRSQRRLIERLAPGPAVFVITLESDALEAARLRIKVGAESVDDGASLAFRIPGPSPAAVLAQRITVPLACAEVLDKSGSIILDPSAAAAALRSAGLEVAAILEDEPIPSRHGATILSLKPGLPEPRILRAGAYEPRFIRKQLALNVLFVCTGNTCRSPMAEAIGRFVAEREVLGLDLHFESAGVGAGSGSPATLEAVDALRAMGINPGRHRSRPLTLAAVREADIIYTMTNAQLNSVLAVDPDSRDKAAILDPTGRDVPDPIGSPPSVYTETARLLADLIARRLKELRS